MSSQPVPKDFFDRYTSLMVSVWQSEGTERELEADPTAQAIAMGMPVSPGAVVVLDRTQPDGLFSKEQLIADWNAQPGRHILHVPAAALIERDELDDRDLDNVSAGVASSVNVVIVACVVAA